MTSNRPLRSVPLAFLFTLAGCGGAPGDGPVISVASTPEANGRALFQQCKTCHLAAKDAPHRVGPNLWGVYGQPAGRLGDFAYSAAMRRADIIWNDETLSAYLEQPQAVIPGGRMAFRGMPNPNHRADLIAYLKTLTDDLPAPENDPPADQ